MIRHLPALAVAVPLGAAAVLAATRELLPRRVLDALTLAVGAAVTLWCGELAMHPGRAEAYWFGGWRPGGGPALGIAFAPDRAGAAVAAFAALLVVLAVAFAAAMFDSEEGLFHVLVLAFLGGMTGFALTADLFDLFVFFELMGVAAFALTGWHADERGPLQGMMTFAVTNTVGAILFLLGTALVYGRTGALNLAAIGRALGRGGADPLAVAAFALIATGFLVKLAVVPFHFWLPDAHAVAPAPVCALFSGIMVPLGAYGVARVHAAAFAAVLRPADVGPPLAALAAAAALVGGLMALVQQHLKRLLAFSTVSHAGVILAGVATGSGGGLAAAALHLAAHGLLKVALFLCAGVLVNRFATADVRRLYGRGREMPEVGVVWLVCAVGLLDLGPTPTGPPAHLLEEAARHAGLGWLGPVVAAATVLSGAAILRAGVQVFLGAGRVHPADPEQGEQGEREEPDASAPPRRVVAFAIPALAAALAYAGRAVPGIAGAAERGAAALLDGPAWRAWVLDGRAAPLPAAGSPHVPLATGVVSALLAVALAALLLARGRVGERAGRALHRVAAPIERLHSGYVGDAVAWIGVGAAVLAAWIAR